MGGIYIHVGGILYVHLYLYNVHVLSSFYIHVHNMNIVHHRTTDVRYICTCTCMEACIAAHTVCYNIPV